MSTQTSGMYQAGQPYQPGQVLGRQLDAYRPRLTVPSASLTNNPPVSTQYMVYRMPDGSTHAVDTAQQQQQELIMSQQAHQHDQLHTINEDEDEPYKRRGEEEMDEDQYINHEYGQDQGQDQGQTQEDHEQDQDAGEDEEDDDDDSTSVEANFHISPSAAAASTGDQSTPNSEATNSNSASSTGGRRPSTQSLQSRDTPDLRVEIPQKQQSRPRTDPGNASTLLRRPASSTGRHNAITAPDAPSIRTGMPTTDAAHKSGVRGRRFPLAVNTTARTAAVSNEPGPQTAMLIEYVQSLPSPSSFQPIVYQQNENYSPMEFGTTPIVGPQQTSAFQWPLPPSSGNNVATAASRSSAAAAPHQPSPLKRNVTKDATASTPSEQNETSSPNKRLRTQL
ncbi:hypothetical protein LPJ66_010846 [Kickxella alabastrina]|uniref:Uncharacterized protein n=1 Tax=Kickxella alabastrina TaxID=61397 RepID=A0ACC1I5E6_9FUNG|nr:hypothetical protein LPJ66_010846 [Kickxella alabastrina]